MVTVERKPALPAVPGAHVMIKNQTAQAAPQTANAVLATAVIINAKNVAMIQIATLMKDV